LLDLYNCKHPYDDDDDDDNNNNNNNNKLQKYYTQRRIANADCANNMMRQ